MLFVLELFLSTSSVGVDVPLSLVRPRLVLIGDLAVIWEDDFIGVFLNKLAAYDVDGLTVDIISSSALNFL